MSQALALEHRALTWYGAVSVERTDAWVKPWRIPHEDRVLFAEGLRLRAAAPSGVRLALRSDTTSVAGRVEPVEEGIASLDLCCDGELVASRPLAGQDGFRFDGLPGGDKLIELWAPQTGEFRLRGLEIGDGASVAPFHDDRPKWVTYGSSITHSGGAESPVYTWPAVVARSRGYNLTNLGYGGNCHLDSMVARVIRDLPADLLSMCVGINIYGSGSLNPRSFREAVIGFVKIVREKHPDTPYAVMSPIWSPPRETTRNAAGFTLEEMREQVAAAVAALRDRGDKNVHYVHGLDVFGPDLGALLPDNVHPSPEGYKVLGKNFAERVADAIFKRA